MAAYTTETVTHVHHWNDTLFSFRATRNQSLRFKNGHFVMIGLETKQRPLTRAYSLASANYEDELEFFSIKVQDGPLTSKLQKLAVGDTILVSQKPTGTLVTDNMLPGKVLYLLGTGTGLAPFLSIVKDMDIYEQFEKIVLVHGVRNISDLAYRDYLEQELPENPFFGELVKEKLIYYPTVTREPFKNNGRVTELMTSGKLFRDLKLDLPTPETARFMLCGSPSMLKDCCNILNDRGFKEARNGALGHYVVERAFVE